MIKKIWQILFVLLILNQNLLSMDIKPTFKWYEKLILYPILVPYYAGKDLFEYVLVKRTITPLHKAATGKNNEALILKLLSQGADVNARDHSGATPLVYALRNQRFELAKVLLENGADVTIQDEFKATAMSYIGSLNDLEILKMMIKRGGNIHEQNDITEDSVLHNVCKVGNANILEYLLFAGAKSDINKVNYRGETPLHLIVQSYSKDKLKLAKILVSNGASLKIKNREGFTPYQLAESLSNKSSYDNEFHPELLQLLKEK